MVSGISSRISLAALLASVLACLLSLHTTPAHGQIFNGNNVVAIATGGSILTTDIVPNFAPGGGVSAPTATPIAGGMPAVTSNITTTAPPPPPPPVPTTPPPPIVIQPYTTTTSGVAVVVPVSATGPLPMPSTPATFPQNISTCSTCYPMFPTLSRCNVIGNSDTFPITPNSTYVSLLPFLKCICTYKALDAYPYCIDCFTKTQQLSQLNVLQANHIENYVDAFRQLCGVTYNGNKVPNGASRAPGSGWERGNVAAMGLAGLAAALVMSILDM
ncbi:hypothetical protein BGZ99_006055 [Dissophora globulifera]|uniref:Uncharacterized protein n=1 Tax=Dissophora globulifera TaxID=979702 RepID=A0A9P6RFZ2_9FUNG|nr:hypothetical protein BGZ99_006055 [Dissophora globulifera]